MLKLSQTIAERDRAVKDAARWLHFREHGDTMQAPPFCYFEIGCAPEELEAHFDAALSSASAGGGEVS